MKYLLEYNSFVDGLDFSEVTTGRDSRSKPLTDKQFETLFNRNCKNYNFDNTQLFRGVFLKYDTDFFFIDGKEQQRGKNDTWKKVIKKETYNRVLRENPAFKDFPDRERCVIGSTHQKGAMIMVGDVSGTNIQEDRTFIMIPYDNVKVAVAPILDLRMLTRDEEKTEEELIEIFNPSRFELLKYTSNFKIKGIPDFKDVINQSAAKAKEVWTEGPCLLVRYSSLPKLRELVEQRS
jgi:hypothetical protein